ncbi:hypothetical protein PM082_015467 [Marasmius tenuissimus]|nr:hypothetical protein PM082_015467 [Marasmius tenuissimus]
MASNDPNALQDPEGVQKQPQMVNQRMEYKDTPFSILRAEEGLRTSAASNGDVWDVWKASKDGFERRGAGSD